MKSTFKTAIATLLFCGLTLVSFGQNDWTEQQNDIINTMNGLSETKAPDGKGAEAYGHFCLKILADGPLELPLQIAKKYGLKA